jgi:hypothetical protein
MSDRNDLSSRGILDVLDKCGYVVRPLGPRVHVPAPAGALAMAAQIKGKGREPMPAQPEREALVPARVLAETVDDRERNLGPGLGPGSV